MRRGRWRRYDGFHIGELQAETNNGQEFSVVRFYGDREKADAVYKGCEPLTPDDIAEIVVFNAGRRENVVVADTLIFPNHQVRRALQFSYMKDH